MTSIMCNQQSLYSSYIFSHWSLSFILWEYSFIYLGFMDNPCWHKWQSPFSSCCSFRKTDSRSNDNSSTSILWPCTRSLSKVTSQYKIYEWMALVHWYIVPIGVELGMNSAILKNFSQFVEIIEFAMTNVKRTDEDLSYLQELIIQFLLEFEALYVGEDPEKINCMMLCIFQLIHVPNHIRWNGSIHLGSQATVEHGIGEMGRKIRSKKAPFANLANLMYKKELIKILCLYYPTLDVNRKQKSDLETALKPIQKHRIHKKYNPMTPVIKKELDSISVLLKQAIISEGNIQYSWWGKLKLLNGHVLSSCATQAKNTTQRQSFWFEVCLTCIILFAYFDWMS